MSNKSKQDTEKKRKKNQSLTEKLFGRFSKKKSSKDLDNANDGKSKKNASGASSSPSKPDKKAYHNGNASKQDKIKHAKPTKFIDVTPAEPVALKETYTIEDVIHYRSQVIRAVHDEKRKNLVTEKLRLCSVQFDFTEIIDDQKSAASASTPQNGKSGKASKKRNVDGVVLGELKRSQSFSVEQLERRQQLSIGIDKKRQMLVEIVEFVSTQKWWDEDVLKELISGVRCNLFRTLPHGNKRKSVKGDDEEEPFLDPQWLHLQLVYELCLRFLISNDIDKKVMQKYLHGSFVLNLIQLFQSEDLRERDYLKTILHRIYGRFMPLRQQIRDEIANECYRYVYGRTRGVYGIAEFLDIFSSIINGFSVPVKDEHKLFLRNVLLPLHKCDKYEMYFQQLADCCVLFVNKEQTMATMVLSGLLQFWPRLSPTKQAFYLREMLNVIGALVEHENGFSFPKYRKIILLCLDKIFECMESPHFQVADQALTLWKDTVMLYLSKCQKEVIWRRLFVIFKNIQLNHWNSGIKQLTSEVVVYYERIDASYWKKLTDEYETAVQDTATGDETEKTKEKKKEKKPNTSTTTTSTPLPHALVPSQYAEEKVARLAGRRQTREHKWKLIHASADHNKAQFVNAEPTDNSTDNQKTDEETKAAEKPPTDDDDGDDNEQNIAAQQTSDGTAAAATTQDEEETTSTNANDNVSEQRNGNSSHDLT